MPSKAPRRLGRPPASSSAATRLRILDVARESFAEMGFGLTTNKALANKAGITTGALYHYFDSKLALYVAVYESVNEYVYSSFLATAAAAPTFLEGFEAALEDAHRLNNEDPSLARFLGAVRVDVIRSDELRIALSGRPVLRVFELLVDRGIATGEIRRKDRELVIAFIRIVVVGLVDGASGDRGRHRLAVDSIRAVIEGRLIGPVKNVAPNARRRAYSATSAK